MADENKYINQDGAKRLVTNFLNITDEINNDIGILFIDSLTAPSQFAGHQYCYIYDAALISTEMTGSWFGIVTYDTARTDSGLVSAESGSVLCIPNSDFSSVFLVRFDSETFTVVEKIASIKDLDGMFLPLSGGSLLGNLRLGNSKSLILSQYSNPDNDNKDYNSVGRIRFTPNNNLMVEFYNRQYVESDGHIHYKGGFIKFSPADVQIGVHDAQELPGDPSSTETSSSTYRICSDGFYPYSSDKDLGSTGYKWRNLYLSGDIGNSDHRANKIYAKNLDLSDQIFVETTKITEAASADFNKLLPTANKMQAFAVSLSNDSSFLNGPDDLTSPNGILTTFNSDAKNTYTPTGYEYRGHAKQTFVSIDGRTFTRYLNNAKWSKWNESLDDLTVGDATQYNPNIIVNGNFRLNDSNKTDWTITGTGDYSEITTVNNWMIGASNTDQTVTASLSDAGLTITACAGRGVYQPFEMKMVDYLKSLFSQSVGKILATVKVNNITGEWKLSQLNGKHNPSQKISTVGTHTVNFEWGDAYYDFQGLFAQNASSTESTITFEWIKAFPIDVYAPDPNIEMLRVYGYSAFSNPNLLDNPDFQINQRGKTTYTIESFAQGFTCDRWHSQKGFVISKNGRGVTVSPTETVSGSSNKFGLMQIIECSPDLWEKPITLSVSCTDTNDYLYMQVFPYANDNTTILYPSSPKVHVPLGVSSVTLDNVPKNTAYLRTQFVFNIGATISDICELEWAKLELGSVATPFVPPNPAEELLKCQRYYQRLIGQMLHVGTGYVSNAGTESFAFMGFCPLPTTIRIINPTVTIHGQLKIWLLGHYGSSAFSANRLVSGANASNMLTLPLAIDSTDVELNQTLLGLPGSIQFRDTESYIEISADL